MRRIDASEWHELRSLRLRALRDAPRAYGSTFDREAAYTDDDWQRHTASAAAGLNEVGVVAVVDGVWAAMARGYLVTGNDPNVPMVARLIAVYVDPRWRGRGLGSAVSEEVVAWARVRGASAVSLHVADWNDVARRIYEKLGFTPTGAAQTLRHDRSVTESEMRLRL